MALSWNEIKSRAISFSKEWEGSFREGADAKPFLVAFFEVFGISRKKVSTFEHRVKKLDEKDGYIDLLWKGTILVEMKSLGRNLDRAFQQAKDYTHGLKQHELPKYILVSDFDRFRLYDMEEDKVIEFFLKDLVFNVQYFGYLIGYQKKIYKEQDPANIKAAELMGRLHDRLEEIGYRGHDLEVYLVRILFCLFAEDTTIFEKQQFQEFIEQRTNEDGSDLAAKLHEVFQVLNTPKDYRFKNLDEQLAAFPYVNGKLFEENLRMASFDSKMRLALLDCCYIDWSKISPAIFGSMFQSVMNPKERRNLGAHYTSETNILKLIKPLFLDELWKEFYAIRDNKNRLAEFHRKISKLKFLDPACGCGNFLVITYRELRLLEIEILRSMNKSGQGFLDVREIIYLDVDMMYGIEYEEFPARIAEVAMWLMDHQMNMLISNEFGQYFVRLPLKKAANIVHGNALQLDWQDLLKKSSTVDIHAEEVNLFIVNEPKAEYQTVNLFTKKVNRGNEIKPSPVTDLKFDYIFGNPPFIGSKFLNEVQRKDMLSIDRTVPNIGTLDYVAGWYIKACKVIRNSQTKVAFVSTNSIVQGEQIVTLWGWLLNQGMHIHFAHRTFQWSNEAKGVAAVHCVIIGFASFDSDTKTIFEYKDIKGNPLAIFAGNINPYLIDAPNVLAIGRSKPLNRVPFILNGSVPADGGNLILSRNEKEEFVRIYPVIKDFVKQYVGAEDFIHSKVRFCLWLKNCPPNILKQMPKVLDRIEGVKNMRLNSSKLATKIKAQTPTIFSEDRQPLNGYYLAIPRTSSENRRYIPIGFLDSTVIGANDLQIVPYASKFHFGVLISQMHMVWAKITSGRLKSDIRYSVKLTYNNYPWPENPSQKQIENIEEMAQKVLAIREEFPGSSLADLYDPLTMPPALAKAHKELDKAVDLAYRPRPFVSEAKRMEFLFELYAKYTVDLFATAKRG